MLVVQRRAESGGDITARLVLPFDLRQKSRLRVNADSGEEVTLFLERGAVLRDGDRLLADDGRIVLVVAAAEDVLRVEASEPSQLVRCAYHLGNRHVPMQIGEGWLRIAADHVLQHMLEALGARIIRERAAFEPERGAYAGHRHSDH